MTCIVAIAENNVVHMCADSAGVGGLTLQNRIDPKIYKNGGYIFGFTSSFRMGQIIGHSFSPPKYDKGVHASERDAGLSKFMCTEFIDALRACLKDKGYAHKFNEVETAGEFLVGYMGKIFHIQNDYQVAESAFNYAACGCGEDLALGSLYTSGKVKSICAVEERLRIALHAAESFSAGVRGPFVLESL